MSGITSKQAQFLGLCLEGFFYGLYSAIFFMYLQYQAAANGTNKTKHILFYALCALYILSSVLLVIGILGALPITINSFSSDASVVQPVTGTLPQLNVIQVYLLYIGATVIGCNNFIAQSILVYRCWIVWSRSIRVIIIPAILAFAFIAIWLVGIYAVYVFGGTLEHTKWGTTGYLTSSALSLIVNVLVTGLIVFRISKVYLGVRAALKNQSLTSTNGSKLRSIIFVLIESGMTLFAVQFILLGFGIFQPNLGSTGYNITIGIFQMLIGITPTIILVRVSMGLSFHDDKSMVEATESLHLASDPILQPASVGLVCQENRDDIGGHLDHVVEV